MSHLIEPRQVFVIIPSYNETETISGVVRELQGFGYQVVVVDDASLVPVSKVLNGLPVYILRHRVNLGQGAAIQTGIDFALSKQARYIVTFDADGQHEAKDIDSLLQTLLDSRVDIVLGSRFMTGASHNMPRRRKSLLQVARYVNYFFTGLLLSDAHNGLRIMTKEAAQKICLRENRMAHATELLAQIKKKRLQYQEAPAQVVYTAYSQGKGQGLWSSFRIFFDLLLNKIFK